MLDEGTHENGFIEIKFEKQTRGRRSDMIRTSLITILV